MVSLGTDAHYRDPLASLSLSSGGYFSLAEKMIKLSQKLCGSRIAFFLEGGYDTSALAEIVTAVVGKFNNHTIDLKYTDNMDRNIIGEEIIKKVIGLHKNYWDL